MVEGEPSSGGQGALEIFLRGLVAAEDGSDTARLYATGPAADAEGVGRRLAAELLDLGAADLMSTTPPSQARGDAR